MRHVCFVLLYAVPNLEPTAFKDWVSFSAQSLFDVFSDGCQSRAKILERIYNENKVLCIYDLGFL